MRTRDRTGPGPGQTGATTYHLLMSAGDWTAPVATAISLLALAFSLRNRRDDIAREEAFRVRERVWTILDREPGLRTVLALTEPDGKTESRIRFLRRTVEQLAVAGAADLAGQLGIVLDQSWGADTSDRSRTIRKEFLESASLFMKPANR